ncbi:MAG: hypothetical protein NXI24_15895 [bacterium]|nr:hypothetical protein [bacterium]
MRSHQRIIEFTRDSVSAGDDIHAPHRIRRKVATNLDACMRTIASWLPQNISGGDATWLIKFGEIQLGIVSQQLESPKLLLDSQELPADCATIHAEYYVGRPRQSTIRNGQGSSE